MYTYVALPFPLNYYAIVMIVGVPKQALRWFPPVVVLRGGGGHAGSCTWSIHHYLALCSLYVKFNSSLIVVMFTK